MFGKFLGLVTALSVSMSGLYVTVWASQLIFSNALNGVQSIIVMNSVGGAGTITSVIGLIMVYAWSENYRRF